MSLSPVVVGGELDPELFEGVTYSRRVRIGGVEIRRPSSDDYANALIAQSRLATAGELDSTPALVAAAQGHWHTSLMNACVFSAHMSTRRGEHGWKTVVLVGDAAADEVARGITREVATACGEAEVELVSAIVPCVKTTSLAARTIALMGSAAGWSVHEDGREHDDLGQVVRVSLRFRMNDETDSEVLGFAPFPTMPRTRQTPFFELALRTKPTPQRRRRRTVLAQVPLRGQVEERAKWHADTIALRHRILGSDHDMRGKARVTVTLPAADWDASIHQATARV